MAIHPLRVEVDDMLRADREALERAIRVAVSRRFAVPFLRDHRVEITPTPVDEGWFSVTVYPRSSQDGMGDDVADVEEAARMVVACLERYERRRAASA